MNFSSKDVADAVASNSVVTFGNDVINGGFKLYGDAKTVTWSDIAGTAISGSIAATGDFNFGADASTLTTAVVYSNGVTY